MKKPILHRSNHPAMCNSNSGRTICLASCNYYNISYPIRQHPFSWKACKTFSLFFVHHAHYLTKTIFVFSAFNQISTLCSPPSVRGDSNMPPLKGEGDRRRRWKGSQTETFFHNISTSRNNPSVTYGARLSTRHVLRPPFQGRLTMPSLKGKGDRRRRWKGF